MNAISMPVKLACVLSTVAIGIGLGTPYDAAGQQLESLGTIQATVDGQTVSWNAVRGMAGATMYSSAMWWEEEGGRILVAVGGFEGADVPLQTFEFDPAAGPISFGDYQGSLLGLTATLPTDAESRRIDLEPRAASTLVYMPRVSAQYAATAHEPGEGVLEVAAWSLDDGKLSVRGTFSGTLKLLNGGHQLSITGGVFEVQGIPHRDELAAENQT